MKKTVAFEKDITFKTKIGELTSISLDNDLTLKGENTIVGSFYIKGTYKMIETSNLEEEYSYKIPCEIAISDEYDTFDSTIDIDDFTYEIINDEILRVNIEVAINNLNRQEEKEETEPEKEEVLTDEGLLEMNEEIEDKTDDKMDELKNLIEEINRPKEKEKTINNSSFMEVKKQVKNEKDTYLTYSIYIYKEEDTIEKVLNKYQISKEQLADYNNLENITIGSKLVIPSFND